MLRHVKSYNSYLLLESVGEMTGLIGEINKAVQNAIASGKDSQEVTQMIRDFFQSNRSEIVDNFGDPNFIKQLIAVVSPWYENHYEDLVRSELADLDSGISLDDESRYDDRKNYGTDDESRYDDSGLYDEDEDLSIDF